ncbi:hypothetical protein Pint_15738 [Pistacia integerrima]|uniref:Uncharacterized protein n=1 Tax=Pistacia integerrima TaxID=434235 RepID=A0ACC0ZDG3_9ROSI|nr:hypothetical protein Pint_15738 [Pistacia integerrima]
MRQKKSEHQITEESSSRTSFDSSTPQQHTNQKQTHLHIQIPLTQSHFQHEITLLSTPHKRPMMTQSLSYSPTFSSLNHHQNNKSLNLESSSHSFLCFSFATNSSAHKLVQTLCRFCLLRFHLRFLILFSLPSLYIFFTNPHRFIVLSFLSILAFFITLFVISLNLALPRFPSLRLVLPRSLPIKFTSLNTSSLKEPLRPVVWSIGSKPKAAKNPISGSWVKVYSNGDVYEGEFHRGKCSGSGVYYYYKKGRYEGDWIDGKYDGYGVETWARGSRYRGQYRQGLRHGIGVYRFYTGDVYAGEWSNGQCHGCGVHTCVDGSRYVGEFKWGVKHGLGHYHFRNGDTYSGEYFADRMHGFGVYQFGNGHRYEGAWHEGRRQGLGMYTFRSGETECGHWQNGVLDVPSARNTHPGPPYPVNHFKVLNAVQEAQRAAAKAYDIAKVDERVNKAVAAANKAANSARVASVKAVQNQRHHSDSDDMPTLDP